MSVPVVKLNSGAEIPQVGYGTWKSKPSEVTEAVKVAIDTGYRHIDCAFIYGNEPEVGAGIKAKIDDGTVKREDLFVTSKLWNTMHRKDLVAGALQTSLDSLGLEYLDLYLIHWPLSYKEEAELLPKDDNGKLIYSEAGFMDAWKEMENCVDAGKVKSIGLSNFNSQQIDRVCEEGRIKPAMAQFESHPYLSRDKLIEFCQERGITVTAYAPLASFDRPWAKESDPVLLKDPIIVAIAERIGKTPAQVVLRWGIQRGVIVIPKSVTPSRIKSNFQLFDFTLNDEDMQTLLGFDECVDRVCLLDWVKDHPNYPFNIPF